MPVRTLLLDADGVVQTTPPRFIAGLSALCPDTGQRKHFLEDLFGAEKPCLTGAAAFPDALADVLRRWHIDAPVAEVLDLWHQISPEPSVLAAIAALRANGVQVCLASNQQAHRAAIMANDLGYARLFDRLFFSCELGVAKPDTGFFHSMLEALDIPGSQAVFIDDNEANVTAAEAAGIPGAVYDVRRDGGTGFAALLRQSGLPVAPVEPGGSSPPEPRSIRRPGSDSS